MVSITSSSTSRICIAPSVRNDNDKNLLHLYAKQFIAHEIKNTPFQMLYCGGSLYTWYVLSIQIYAMTRDLVAAAALVLGIQAWSAVALALPSSLGLLATLDPSAGW